MWCFWTSVKVWKGVIILSALLSMDVCSHVWERQWWKSERRNLLWRWTESRGTWLHWEQWRERARAWACAYDAQKTWTQTPKSACCYRRDHSWNPQGMFLCLLLITWLNVSWFWAQKNFDHKPHCFFENSHCCLSEKKKLHKSCTSQTACVPLLTIVPASLSSAFLHQRSQILLLEFRQDGGTGEAGGNLFCQLHLLL